MLDIFKYISKKDIILLVVVLMAFLYVLGLDYVTTQESKENYMNFTKDNFSKIEIEVVHHRANKQLKIELIDKDKIKHLHDIFKYNVEMDSSKKAGLYDYSVFLTFFSANTDTRYELKVFFYAEKVPSRPIFIRGISEGSNDDMFSSVTLKDPEFHFYNLIMELWRFKELRLNG